MLNNKENKFQNFERILIINWRFQIHLSYRSLIVEKEKETRLILWDKNAIIIQMSLSSWAITKKEGKVLRVFSITFRSQGFEPEELPRIMERCETRRRQSSNRGKVWKLITFHINRQAQEKGKNKLKNGLAMKSSITSSRNRFLCPRGSSRFHG